ncbi:MAG: NFACT RNA binding domain-containing protein [Spirochaetota bacterium]
MTELEIQKAVEEMRSLVAGSRVEKVAQLDDRTLVIFLSGSIREYSIVVVLQKRSCRFHCLFEKIHPDYTIHSRISSVIESITKKGTIKSLGSKGGTVEIEIFMGKVINLRIDFSSGVLSITGRGAERVVLDFFNPLKKRSDDFEEAGSQEVVNEPSVKCGNSDISTSFDVPPNIGGRQRVPMSSGNSDISTSFDVPQGISERKHLLTSAELPLNEKLSRQFMESRNSLLRQRILRVIKGEQKKVSKLIEKLMFEKRELDEREKYMIMGELLKYNLPSIKRGMKTITLSDYSGNRMDIALNETLSPRENMNRYFDRYRKLRRKERVFSQKLSYEMKRLAAIDFLISHIVEEKAISITAPCSEFLKSLDERFFRRDLIERIRRAMINKPARVSERDEDKRLYLQFYSRTGKKILVGRNARENEELTLRVARGNDLWFHVEEGVGSHVVLQYIKGCVFDESDIIDASTLALYFSKFRQAGKGNVVYTFRKYVGKPKGSKQGYVTYYKNKTKHVVLDEKLLQKLIYSKGTVFQVSNDTDFK